MTESTVPQERALEPAEKRQSNAGAMLRQAREAAGLHLESLALTLKVPVWKLEAIESDQWDLLPDKVFARALTASLCRTLKLDPAEVLGKLPSLAPMVLPQGEGINEPFRGASGAGSGTPVLSRPLLLAVLALLLGTAILILLPSLASLWIKMSPGPIAASKGVAGSVSQPAVEVTPSVPSPVALPSSSAVLVPDPVNADALPAPMPGLPASAASAGLTPTAPAQTPSTTALQPPSSAGTSVVFRTTAPSWIQVTDARGTVVLKKLLEAGESASVSGALPLAILVGRVDVTTVEVGGKPFDLTSVSRDNVARFEVKQ